MLVYLIVKKTMCICILLIIPNACAHPYSNNLFRRFDFGFKIQNGAWPPIILKGKHRLLQYGLASPVNVWSKTVYMFYPIWFSGFEYSKFVSTALTEYDPISIYNIRAVLSG